MKLLRLIPFVMAMLAPVLSAQTALTIYNQDLALVHDRVPMDLKKGENTVPFVGVTAHLEPDSVVLRDPAGKANFQILEQSYRADALSPEYLLQQNEGKTIDFIVRDKDNREYVVKGRVIRSGGDGNGRPIIEVDGKLRFSSPGEPVFPSLGNDTILKPTMTWRLAADSPVKFDAELSYLTHGLSWNAAYNLVAAEKGDDFEFVGWMTFKNYSGKEFTEAKVNLVAGNVNNSDIYSSPPRPSIVPYGVTLFSPTQKNPGRTLDEFHYYNLPRALTLHDRETKQVEFVQAMKMKTTTFYVYDGFSVRNLGAAYDQIRTDQNYGTQSNNKVWVMREFNNTAENGLGLALPAGRIRLYRRDSADNSLQFVGENVLDHTAANELVRLYTGDAFDLVGERKRTDYKMDERNKQMEEEFEIKVRNHKTEPVEIRVVEHLYRWYNWDLMKKSDDFIKTDAQTLEFRVTIKPNEEKVITYRVHYDWK